MLRSQTAALLTLAGFIGAACGSDKSPLPPGEDGGPAGLARDATVGDAGLLEHDAGSADARDAGASDVDASATPDAGSTCDHCTPRCEGRECGDDGCGGVCGACDPTNVASVCHEALGRCMQADCNDCRQTQCGPGSFYTSCGECPGGWTCGFSSHSAGAVCLPSAGGCIGIPEGGACINGVVVTCKDGEPDWQFCRWRECSVKNGLAACAAEPCIPDCYGRTCGSDGCGGSCGSPCGGDETCRDGICVPTTCTKDLVRCEGETVVRCDGPTLALQSCPAEGKVCVEDECGPRCALALSGRPCPAGLPQAGHCEGGHLFRCNRTAGGAATLRVEHCVESGLACVRSSSAEFTCSFCMK